MTTLLIEVSLLEEDLLTTLLIEVLVPEEDLLTIRLDEVLRPEEDLLTILPPRPRPRCVRGVDTLLSGAYDPPSGTGGTAMGRSQIWTVTIRGRVATVEELLEHEERPRASYVPAELAAMVAAPTRAELTALYTFLTGRPWLHRSRSVRAMSSPIRPTPADVDSSAAVVLQHYAEQYCEGMCRNDAELARFDGDCGGCLARRTVHQIEIARQNQEAQR